MSKRIQWHVYPLIAFAFVTISPIIYGAFVSALLSYFNVRGNFFVGRLSPGESYILPQTFGINEYVEFTLFMAGGNWFYLVLFLISFFFGRKSIKNIGRFKNAMWTSIIFMTLLNLLVILSAPLGLFSDVREAGQVTGVLLAGIILFGPIFGSIGWLLGWMVAWPFRAPSR
jgi:hypothetical protein